MKKYTKLIFLIMPLIIWGIKIGVNIYGSVITDQYLVDANGLVWNNGQEQLKSDVHLLSHCGDFCYFLIKISDTRGEVLYEEEVEIVREYGSDGFVAAMQVDTDPELEIVYLSLLYYGQPAFYLDMSTGKVEQKNIKSISPQAKQLVKEWLKYHAINPFAVLFCFIGFIVTILFYAGWGRNFNYSISLLILLILLCLPSYSYLSTSWENILHQ